MSRFSLVNVIGRRSSAVESESRPSVISVSNLNKQLEEEKKLLSNPDPHLFFGPQQHVFDGKDRTRVIHGERKIQKNSKRVWLVSEPLSMERDSTTSIVGVPPEVSSKNTLFLGTVTTITAASRFLGQKVAQIRTPPTHVNVDSFCDGCGMDPIIGNMYTCSRCDNYSLCEGCYQSGVHGYENSELLRSVREDFALRSIMETCRNRVPEKVFEVLMRKVCKGQVDKFNFMSNWIAEVVLGSPVSELSVRGIEIPHLDNEARSVLVGELTPVLAERTDLEICMEWFNPNANNDEVPSSAKKLETLRIWISTDKNSKSPFKSQDDWDDTLNSPDVPDSPGSPTSPVLSTKILPDTIVSPGAKCGAVPGSPSTTAVTSSPPPSPMRGHSVSDPATTAESDEEYLSGSDCTSAISYSSDIQTQACAGTSMSGEISSGIAM